MAVAVTGTPNVQSNTSSPSDKTLTFSSTTYGANEILTVDVMVNNGTNSFPTTSTPTGGGLTWTLILAQNGSGSTFSRTASWWANTGAGGTYTVSQASQRVSSDNQSTRGVLTRHTGAHLTVPIGQTDPYTGSATDPLTSNTNLRLQNVLAGSMIHAVGGDWSAGTTVTLTFDNSVADTEAINANESGQMHFCAFRSTDALSSSIADLRAGMDVSGATGDWACVMYEILAAADPVITSRNIVVAPSVAVHQSYNW